MIHVATCVHGRGYGYGYGLCGGALSSMIVIIITTFLIEYRTGCDERELASV